MMMRSEEKNSSSREKWYSFWVMIRTSHISSEELRCFIFLVCEEECGWCWFSGRFIIRWPIPSLKIYILWLDLLSMTTSRYTHHIAWHVKNMNIYRDCWFSAPVSSNSKTRNIKIDQNVWHYRQPAAADQLTHLEEKKKQIVNALRLFGMHMSGDYVTKLFFCGLE